MKCKVEVREGEGHSLWDRRMLHPRGSVAMGYPTSLAILQVAINRCTQFSSSEHIKTWTRSLKINAFCQNLFSSDTQTHSL